MRKGRFSGLNEAGRSAVAPLALAKLILFDFRVPEDDQDERVAVERARMLAVSTPFLAASHILWSCVTLYALHRAGAGAILAPVAALFAASVAVDLGLVWLLRGSPSKRLVPHMQVLLAAGAILAGAALWGGAISLVAGPDSSTLVRAGLIAGVTTPVIAFFPLPGLLILSCIGTLAGVFLLRSGEPFLEVGAPITALCGWLSITRARDLILGTHQRLAMEWEAKKARRFVADYEESGRGWFWETNADGLLTYVSEQIGEHLGGDALVGRPFDDIVQGGGEGEVDGVNVDRGDDVGRTLGFHLGARFPFADVIVRAPGEGIWWSLSGSPNFDAMGRFLGFRGIGTNLSEQRRSEAEASKLARYDSLTGLANRSMMRRTLDEALANAAERQRGCALMMIDLDRFKAVNDTLGHPMGDKLLKEVAQRLSAVVGDEGQVGRLGGDEFEAILPGTEEEGRLASLAARIIGEVSRIYSIDGHEISIGASVGISVGKPGRTYAETLIKEADLALYAAKAAGRGTFRMFVPAMHAEATERRILEAELRDALGKGQLAIQYQPQVVSVTEEVVAFEALLRWQHPTRGPISSPEITALGEEAGIMAAIGEWTMRTACADAASWPSHVRVAVNLSPSQFADPSLPVIVTAALAASGLDAERLELEISEAVFLADEGATEAICGRLRALGVRLALDNYGTGQCGLGHFRTVAVDKIKIDQSFVQGAAEAGSRNAAIVRAIVVLAESLNMETTAEGAETREHLAVIRRLGCSQVQGLIFGEPMDAAEAAAKVSETKPPAEVAGFSRPPRHRLIRTGRLVVNGKALEVRLRNISAGGAAIECDRPHAPDTIVTLDLAESGTLAGRVIWCQHGQIGIKFDTAFNLKQLARPARPKAQPQSTVKPAAAAAGAAKPAPKAPPRQPTMMVPDFLSKAIEPDEEDDPLLKRRGRG